MKAIQFEIEGSWGHFKKPETNNNPLTHDFIPKTALIGMIGAVLGKNRKDMNRLFPILSEGLLYSVKLLNPVKKISCGFTSSTAINPTKQGSPKYFEFLENPKFKIILTLKNKNAEVIFKDFNDSLINEKSLFNPVLGWHNCPANLCFINEGSVEKKEGKFETNYFIEKNKQKLETIGGDFRIGFDKIPTYQEDFWNKPEYYKEIIYPDAGKILELTGEYFEFNKTGEKCWLI